METEYQDIRVDNPAPGVVRVTLAREKQRNAYSMRMCRELLAALLAFDSADGLRVLVLTGAGRGF